MISYIQLLTGYVKPAALFVPGAAIACGPRDKILADDGVVEAIFLLNRKQRMSLILITRNLDFITGLDKSVQSTLLHNVVRFDKYSVEQLYDIIRLAPTMP